MVDAPLQVDLEQQVGNGVEGAFQVVPGAAQRLRHAMGQPQGAVTSRGHHPGQHTRHQAQGHAHRGQQDVIAVLEALLESRQRLHHQRPGAPAQRYLLRGAQTRCCALRGCSKVCVAIQQALGGLRVAVINDQVDIGIKLPGHSLQQIVHAKGCRNPAHNAPLAALHRAEVGILAIKRQVHDQPGHGITPHVLLQPEPGGQGQFAGVARAVQRLAGGGNGGNIEPQRLEVVAGLGLDVGDRGVVRLRDLRVHVVRQEAFVAHLLHMGVQLVCRQIQHIGHALQPGQGFGQAQRPHIGLKLLALNAAGAVVKALNTAQHQFVGGHPVFEAGDNAVHRNSERLVPFGARFALRSLPVHERQSQQEKRQHRPRQHKQAPTVFLGGQRFVLAGLAHGSSGLDGCRR